MYTVVAQFERGPITYSVTSEEEALALMDQFHEGDVAYAAADQDGRVVDENDLTDRIDARPSASPSDA
jgi:hypothetical protein